MNTRTPLSPSSPKPQSKNRNLSNREPKSSIKITKNNNNKNSKKSETINAEPQMKSISQLSDSQMSDIKGLSNVFKELNKTTKEQIDFKKKYELLKKRVEFLKMQEEKIKKDNLKEQKKEEMKNKILEEKKRDKESILNYFKEKENRIKEQSKIIKEKFKEENKMLKSVNEELSKKNRKQYDTLKNEKEKLEEKKKEKADEQLDQKQKRVKVIRKLEEKEKSEKESVTDKNNIKGGKKANETLNSVLTPQQKVNYLLSKDLIEQYKNFCEELIKQEQLYIQKIEDAKKQSKARSGSAGRIRVFVPKNKNKDLKNRTKSSSKIGIKHEGGNSIMKKYHIQLKEIKKNSEKGSTNIQKINTNDI